MLLVVGALVAAACTSATTNGTLAAPVVADIDSVAVWYMRTRSIPGLSIALVRDGDLLLSRSYGFATLDPDSVRVDSGTLFELGSIKKPVTAVAILRLVERGTLSLDDPVQRWAASIQVPDPPVRLRDMLHQVSGLPADVDDDDVIDHLDFPPGTRWAYRNANFDRLDEVIHAATGLDFTSYLSTRLTGPLGLTSLGMCHPGDPRPPDLARGYVLQDGRLEAVEDPCWFRGTPRDLALWVDALFNGRVLGDAALDDMLEPAVLADGRVVDYGLGVALRPHRGVRRYSHTGHVDGFAASFGYYPDSGVAIAVAANSESLFDPDGLEMAIADILLGLRDTEEVRAFAGDSRRLTGSWVADGITFELASGADGTLRMAMRPGGGRAFMATRLRPAGPFRFVGVDSPDAVALQLNRADPTRAVIYVVGIPWDVTREP